jgi:hypothetical protein
MLDSQLNRAERPLQAMFINFLIAGAFLLLASDSRADLPDRTPMPARIAELTLKPLNLPTARGVTITGAWTLSANDPRVFGLSALTALPKGPLEALSDSGTLVTFSRPGGETRALVSELPAGPGFPTFKRYRDSEAMLVRPDAKSRLVAFENQHSLWRYGADGSSQTVPVALPSARWKRNTGIEAMVEDPADGALLLLNEAGRQVIRVTGAAPSEVLPLAGATGGIADAARLPDGRMVVAVREIGLLGLTNRLAWLERAGGGYRLRIFATLPLGVFDNVEGLAAEPRVGGGALLWAVTDSDGWRRTLLLRMELDATKAPARAGA